MTAGHADKVVFDFTVFARALISSGGPAGACITHVQRGNLTLFVSGYVIQEIRELPAKNQAQIGRHQ